MRCLIDGDLGKLNAVRGYSSNEDALGALRPLVGLSRGRLWGDRGKFAPLRHENEALYATWPSENDAVIGGKVGLYWTRKQ